MTLVGAVLASGTLATSRIHTERAPRARGVAASGTPCGGEALNEDTFPPLTAVATPARPGGTGDAPGSADGRPEEWLPDAKALETLLRREGATVRMSSFSTSFAHASPSQAANIALVAKKLTGLVIPAGTVFSYNEAAGPFTAAGGYGWGRMFVGDRIVPTIGGGVCQGASTLYNVVLLANLPVVERHLHGLTVPYLAPGRDATVTEEGGLDFRFRNNTGGPLVLWGEAVHRQLTLAMYGTTPPPQVKVFTAVLSRTPFPTKVIRDPDLPPGKAVVAATGQEGVRARAWVVVTLPDGKTVRHELPTHTYRPSPRIILRGVTPRHGSAPSASSGSRPAAAPSSTP